MSQFDGRDNIALTDIVSGGIDNYFGLLGLLAATENHPKQNKMENGRFVSIQMRLQSKQLLFVTSGSCVFFRYPKISNVSEIFILIDFEIFQCIGSVGHFCRASQQAGRG